MSYATVADLEAYASLATLTRLTTPLGQVPALDSARVQLALDQASSQADSYLAKRTPVPLAVWPPVLTLMVGTLALLQLYRSCDGQVPPDDVKDAAEGARRWLKDVADGTLDLGLPPVTPTDPSGASSAQFARVERFDRFGGGRGW